MLPRVLLLVLAGAAAAQAPIRYDRDIRPILADRCFVCHGPDANKREAELRLDRREDAILDRGGYAAIVPGNAKASELWARIHQTDPEEVMPPKKANKRPLTPEERALLGRWIDAGAVYEPHWSFVPPRRPEVPAVASAWVRNPIDAFIAAGLAGRRLSPAEPAPRETLARRVFLDLTGLPPTPEELDAFLADARPDAYEHLVRRLLHEEPYVSRYAERMTTPWLDAARYADTIGIHTDAGRTLWPYRDWVLEAFRSGMPYDRFVTEQLAGDLLPDATLASKVASGFQRCQVQTDEGGAIPAEYLVEYAVERVATTGAVFLGLTLGCARCHDHKFEPITQRDFYSLYAFFNSIEEPGLFSQLPDPKRAFEPFLAVPDAAQQRRQQELEARLGRLRQELEQPDPQEDAQRTQFQRELEHRLGLRWAEAVPTAAKAEGAALTLEADQAILPTGPNPNQDGYEVRLATKAAGLRLLAVHVLADERMPHGRIGRAPNGNAVLTEVTARAISLADPARTQPVRFVAAWADHEQPNQDYAATNVIDGVARTGWALEGHQRRGDRLLLLLAAEPFGFDGGTELVVQLEQRSVHAQHNLGRFRLAVAQLGDDGLAALPLARGAWQIVGPFPPPGGASAYDTVFGPESDRALDPAKNFGAGNQYWRWAEGVRDGVVARLPDGQHATYVGRRIFAPTARTETLSLGSDDALRLFVDGTEVFAKNVERGAAPDQERVAVELTAGPHVLVAKIVNTGGPGGFYHRRLPRAGELADDLLLALAPPGATAAFAKRARHAWRTAHSPGYREKSAQIAAAEQELRELEAAIPRTMVMKELDKPREAFVLTRGMYDKPDKARPAPRAVPAVLGKLPPGAPNDRLGLARWLVAPDHPLTARVAVNRLWETVFGTGLVRTSEDFGQMGEWPSHELLLDWLATEYQRCGWDTKAMLTLLVTSATYRQSSRVRAEAVEVDPDNRLLAYFPRRRLSGEQLRDQALYLSGLLVEKRGGPPVKPYQPPGLWEEVAMPASNTRVFVRGKGEELWRRSVYTYWKRASPPPALLAFDAPTRESCAVRRPSTSTPLQTLVLWNDEQHVEAARALAQRTLAARQPEAAALAAMHRRVTGRLPGADAARALAQTLAAFRARFRAAPADAALLLAVGEAPRDPSLDPVEHAAWTLLANALLNLDATICRD